MLAKLLTYMMMSNITEGINQFNGIHVQVVRFERITFEQPHNQIEYSSNWENKFHSPYKRTHNGSSLDSHSTVSGTNCVTDSETMTFSLQILKSSCL